MKNKFIMVMLSFGLIPLAQAQNKNELGDEKIKGELIALVKKWDEATIKHDTVTLGYLLADEFTLSGTSRANYLAYIKSPQNVTISSHSLEFDIRVYKEKEMAVLIAIDLITSQTDSARVRRAYRYIDVWIKREGRWQCIVTESHEFWK